MNITRKKIDFQDGIERTLVIVEKRGYCFSCLYALPMHLVTDKQIKADQRSFKPYYGAYGY